jgi:hypothetical protein
MKTNKIINIMKFIGEKVPKYSIKNIDKYAKYQPYDENSTTSENGFEGKWVKKVGYLTRVYNYVNGVLEGDTIETRNGDSRIVKTYKNGEITLERIYNGDNIPTTEITYVDGERATTTFFFYTGVPKHVINYIKGTLAHYDMDGTMRNLHHFEKGHSYDFKTGPAYGFNKDGILTTYQQYKHNQNVGLTYHYNDNGDFMFAYDNDALKYNRKGDEGGRFHRIDKDQIDPKYLKSSNIEIV